MCFQKGHVFFYFSVSTKNKIKNFNTFPSIFDKIVSIRIRPDQDQQQNILKTSDAYSESSYDFLRTLKKYVYLSQKTIPLII